MSAPQLYRKYVTIVDRLDAEKVIAQSLHDGRLYVVRAAEYVSLESIWHDGELVHMLLRDDLPRRRA